jgi:RNA polymerase sigma-70 factor (ECF subfamily)
MAPEYQFEKLYNEYYPTILRYVARIVGQNDAEDITQEVFSKINSGLAGFQGKSKLSTWIYRIATNTAIDRTRSAAHKHATEHIDIEGDAVHDFQRSIEGNQPLSTDRLVIQKEMSECIKEYIGTLPPDYKTVIILSEMEGLTNTEIAEILNITLNNVKIRLHRARARLKAVLDGACDFYYSGQSTLCCDRKQAQILPKPPK